jgi:hypothetical protein
LGDSARGAAVRIPIDVERALLGSSLILGGALEFAFPIRDRLLGLTAGARTFFVGDALVDLMGGEGRKRRKGPAVAGAGSWPRLRADDAGVARG